MKNIFVINHFAGNGKLQSELAEKIKSVSDALGIDSECYETKCIGDAFNYIYSLPDGDKRVFACGGDGTLREVVNAIAKRDKSNEAVGVIPCGTGNDFVRSFTDPSKFSDISAQLQGSEMVIDLIKVDGDYCINMANVGFDANVAKRMVVYKKRFGKFAYEAALVAELFSSIKYPMKIRFDDGEVYDGNYLLLSIANGNAYGGGFISAPKARLNDGFIDICACRLISRLKFIGCVGEYKKGHHLNGRFDFITAKRCRSLSINFDKPTNFCQDGEIIEKSKVNIEVIPSAIKLVVPKGCKAAN